MNAVATVFLVVCSIGVLIVPRRWALAPLLAGACYMTLGQGFNLGPFNFTVIRVLILVGAVRILFRQERIIGRMNRLDWGIVAFGLWAIISSAFHQAGEDGNPWVYRLGLAYNTCGIYFLTRVWCRSKDDVVCVIRVLAFLLAPLALEMAAEKITARNFFSVLGGVPPTPPIRDGSLRAMGPFGHPILAGTVGAVCFPLICGILRTHRAVAVIGLSACTLIVFASSSSGPIMSAFAGAFALIMWRFRHLTRLARIGAVACYVLLDIVMKAEPYYLLARIDISGGSTGWHRAELIDSAIRHLNEWWLGGTDYTRHWMPTGVSWSANHTDLTNHYIKMGVLGGLPLMLLFIFLLWTAFRFIGETLHAEPEISASESFFVWCLGAALFAHVATCISITYFDQSFIFVYITFAVIGSMRATRGDAMGDNSESSDDVALEPSSV
ncbi:MAG: hypothetical protein KIS67_21495 [Verrucomicrobiae bacterium]|nr:hypothetical protein [Verrucomicrobiae bacterium]